MSVSARWHAPAAAAPRRPTARVPADRGGWWARWADDREMVGVKLVLLAVVVALALAWEVPGWVP